MIDRYLDKALTVGFCILIPSSFGFAIYSILKADTTLSLVFQIFVLVFWTLLMIKFALVWRESIPLLKRRKE